MTLVLPFQKSISGQVIFIASLFGVAAKAQPHEESHAHRVAPKFFVTQPEREQREGFALFQTLYGVIAVSPHVIFTWRACLSNAKVQVWPLMDVFPVHPDS